MRTSFARHLIEQQKRGEGLLSSGFEGEGSLARSEQVKLGGRLLHGFRLGIPVPQHAVLGRWGTDDGARQNFQ